MISRRNILKMLSSLPLGVPMVGGLAGADAAGEMLATGPATASTPARATASAAGADESIYASLGVRPLINARGTVTVVGATRVLPEVRQAMEAATRDYVQLDELMDGVGRRLAELTGTEWGIVTSGASGAITAATAGIVTGGDPDKLWQVPDLTGMKDEVIIPSYSRTAYDAAARAVGANMVEVADREELEAALGPQTAMIMVLAGSRSEEGPLSLEEIASLARPRDVPILVDAAAEVLPVPNPHLEQGADLVAYSGGKCLCGPQCAGLLLGRKDLVQAAWIGTAPHHGPGRGYKVGREEIMGMLAAVEMWMERDHEAEQRTWTSWLEHIADRLAPLTGVDTEIRQPQRRSNRFPSLSVQWEAEQIPLTGDEVERLLWEGDPRVAVSGAGSFLPFPPNTDPGIRINPSQLEAGEEQVIADRVFEVLSDPPERPLASSGSADAFEAEGMAFAFWPPHTANPDASPAADLSGQWDLEMAFAASVVQQTLVFEQDGNDLVGTHRAGFASRDLAGALHGNDLLMRSSYTGEGVRLNFTFTGTVSGDTMEGQVSLGEYGMADWKATRRSY